MQMNQTGCGTAILALLLSAFKAFLGTLFVCAALFGSYVLLGQIVHWLQDHPAVLCLLAIPAIYILNAIINFMGKFSASGGRISRSRSSSIYDSYYD